MSTTDPEEQVGRSYGRTHDLPHRLLRSDESLAQVARFLVTGGTNTVATALLYVLLQHYVERHVAYTIVFAAGIAYSTVLNSRFVFRGTLTVRSAAQFFTWYGAVYCVGLGVISLVGLGLHSSWLTALVLVGFVAPLNFVVGRRIFHLTPIRAAA